MKTILPRVSHGLAIAAVAALTLFGCAYDDFEPGPEDREDRGALGKADRPSGSCAADDGDNFCGDQSDDRCWCDDQCERYGDCCGDYAELCHACEPSTCDDRDCGETDDGCGGTLDCPCAVGIVGEVASGSINTSTVLKARTASVGSSCAFANVTNVWGGRVVISIEVNESNGALRADLEVRPTSHFEGTTFTTTLNCASPTGGCTNGEDGEASVFVSVPLAPLEDGVEPVVPMTQGWHGRASHFWGTVSVSADSTGAYLEFDAHREAGACGWASIRRERTSKLSDPPLAPGVGFLPWSSQ